jgi:hypothetical protein
MTTELECLDGPEGCEGEVELRWSPDNLAKPWPRCDAHFARRLEQAEHNLELMSPAPPDWFDESYAGERWDED